MRNFACFFVYDNMWYVGKIDNSTYDVVALRVA